MRTLTEGEARVVGALLGSTLLTERARLHRAAVPRSTYHAARRRAYAEGWLRDRYIPNPVEFGLPFASFVLARPFAERLSAYVQDSEGEISTVYLACSSQLALTVGLYPTEADARRACSGPIDRDQAAWSAPIVADLRGPSVPVYFDYEGLFAHFGEVEGAAGYPQGLGGVGAVGSPDPEQFAARRRSWGAVELARRPFGIGGESPPAHRIGPVGLPWGQRKLLNQGWFAHRVLLDPAAIPPFQGRSAQVQVFVSGTWRSGARPEELFAALTRDARVFPFLFVAGDGRLLMGALGQAQGSGGTSPGRPSVMGVLRDRIEGIEILQEPASQMRSQVDHRYDRLFVR